MSDTTNDPHGLSFVHPHFEQCPQCLQEARWVITMSCHHCGSIALAYGEEIEYVEGEDE